MKSDDPLGVFSSQGFSAVPLPFTLLAAIRPPGVLRGWSPPRRRSARTESIARRGRRDGVGLWQRLEARRVGDVGRVAEIADEGGALARPRHHDEVPRRRARARLV